MNCVSEVSQFSRPKCRVLFAGSIPIQRRSESSMNVTESSLNLKLTESQVSDLARPLMGILERFYQDPKNEEDYQKWLLSVEELKSESTETDS